MRSLPVSSRARGTAEKRSQLAVVPMIRNARRSLRGGLLGALVAMDGDRLRTHAGGKVAKDAPDYVGLCWIDLSVTSNTIADPAVGSQPRARQNVVFELGFFIGKLGRANVAALMAPAVEKPSDFDGIAYIPYSAGSSWKTELARELHHAKVRFDAAAVLTA
jgi:Predicted nucleotide-binding protein containing TIR-like domain